MSLSANAKEPTSTYSRPRSYRNPCLLSPPLFFTHFVGNDASPYAYIYVYATIAAENVAFAYANLRPTRKVIRLPFRYSYHNFEVIPCVAGTRIFDVFADIAGVSGHILSPRQIYANTRTGFGVNFYISVFSLIWRLSLSNSAHIRGEGNGLSFWQPPFSSPCTAAKAR